MKISHWISAFRLRTLFLSLSCIWAGLICSEVVGKTNVLVSIFTFLTALFLQILSNLANDYGDSIHGADHAGRKGPSRAVQSGAISKEQMKRGLIIAAVLSFISGCCLLYFSLPAIGLTASLVLLGIGILSILAAIAYTNGKRPYGYAGLGDISVFIFFGWVAVLGAQYLQTSMITEAAIYLSITYGLLSVGVLNLNNMRDIESDESAGKKSIPVRLGLVRAKLYHSLVLIFAILGIWGFFSSIHQNMWFAILPSILISINIYLASKAKDHASFDPLLKWLSLSTFISTLIIQICL